MSELLCEQWWKDLDAALAPDDSIAASLAGVRQAISDTTKTRAPEGRWSANYGCHQYNLQLGLHCDGLREFQLVTGSVRDSAACKEIESCHYFLTHSGASVGGDNEIVIDASWMQFLVPESFDIMKSIFVGSRKQLLFVFRKYALSLNPDKVEFFALQAGIDQGGDVETDDFVKAKYLFGVEGAHRTYLPIREHH